MTENQLKRQQAIDALEIALIDLRARNPISQVKYNLETAMLCLDSLQRSRKSEMKDEVMADAMLNAREGK